MTERDVTEKLVVSEDSYNSTPPPITPRTAAATIRFNQILLFGISYISYTALYGTRKPLSVVKTHLEVERNFTPGELGLIDTGFLASYALGQTFLTPFIQRYIGPINAIPLALAGSVLCACVFALGELSAWTLTLIWAGNGIFQASVAPLFFDVLAPWFDGSNRGQVLGMWTTSQQIGSLTATGLAAFVTRAISWRAAFFIPSAILSAMVVLNWFGLRGRPDPKLFGGSKRSSCVADVPCSSPVDNKSHAKPRLSDASVDLHDVQPTLLDVFRIPDLVKIAFAYFFIKLCRYSLLMWLPYYLARAHGFSPENAGYVSTVFDLGGIGGALVSGVLSDTLLGGRRALTATIMSTATTLSIAAIGTVTSASAVVSPGLLVGLLTLVGFCIAGPDSILGAAGVHDLCERSPWGNKAVSTAAGITNGVGGIGAIFSALIAAKISERFGWAAVFQVLAGFCALSVILLLTALPNENAHKRYHSIAEPTDAQRKISAAKVVS